MNLYKMRENDAGIADTVQTRRAEEENYFEEHNRNDVELLDALEILG